MGMRFGLELRMGMAIGTSMFQDMGRAGDMGTGDGNGDAHCDGNEDG